MDAPTLTLSLSVADLEGERLGEGEGVGGGPVAKDGARHFVRERHHHELTSRAEKRRGDGQTQRGGEVRGG